MKKIVITFLLTLLTLTMSAQIQRTFFGCSLGSSKNIVKKNLIAKGYKLHFTQQYIYIRNVKFGGEIYTAASFTFVNNKLCHVVINMSEDDCSYFNSLYKDVKNRIYNKYKDYKEGEDLYRDTKTVCAITTSGNLLKISYSDRNLLNIEQNQINNNF